MHAEDGFNIGSGYLREIPLHAEPYQPAERRRFSFQSEEFIVRDGLRELQSVRAPRDDFLTHNGRIRGHPRDPDHAAPLLLLAGEGCRQVVEHEVTRLYSLEEVSVAGPVGGFQRDSLPHQPIPSHAAGHFYPIVHNDSQKMGYSY